MIARLLCGRELKAKPTSSSLSDAALSCIVCAIKKAIHIVKERDEALPLL